VSAVAIDETSCRRGHNYLTIAADMGERKVVFVTDGKSRQGFLTVTRKRISRHQVTVPKSRFSYDLFGVNVRQDLLLNIKMSNARFWAPGYWEAQSFKACAINFIFIKICKILSAFFRRRQGNAASISGDEGCGGRSARIWRAPDVLK